MTPRVTGSRRMLVFVVVIVARAAMTDGTLAPPGDQRITTSRDGCRIQPADDGVGVHVDCAGLRLGHIPGDLPTDMTRLKMRRNNITRLDGNPFERYTKLTSLDLSRNDLETVGSNVFADVLRLEELELTYNQLCMNKNTFHVGLFSGMASLRRLTLTSNACKTQHTAYPDEALAKLTNLQFLSLTGIPTSRLGEGFGRLTNLKTLVFAGHGCKMPVLTNKTFEILRNVRLSHLSLKTCRLKTLEAGALEPLSHLKTLNLACNHDVDFINIYTAIITAKNMKLKTLVVDDVTPTTLLLDDEQFAHNAFTDVERMSLRANYIMQVDVRKLRPLKKLTHFNLGYNVIGSILPDVNSSAALFTILFGLNLDVVDVSDIFTNVTTYRHRYCFREAKSEEEDPTDPTEYFFREPPPFDDLNYSRVRPSTKPSAGNMTSDKEHERLTIPPSVQVVYADHILPPLRSRRETAKMNVSADNNVVVLNVSYNPFTAIGPIRGLHRLQMVDFRHCAIETISPGALSDLRMLKYLYLMNNRIGTKGTNLKGAFDGLSSLEVLDLSGNAISQIHVSAFSGLTSLRILSLRENQLTSVSFDISGLLHLATINLAGNSITRIYPNTMDFIKRRHIHVIMYGNPIATTRQSRKNLVIVVCVLCAVALVVGLAVAVFVVRRQRSRNCLGNATRRDGEDDDLLQPDELLDDIIPDLPAGVPDPLELGEQMPGEMQLQVQQPGQCEET